MSTINLPLDAIQIYLTKIQRLLCLSLSPSRSLFSPSSEISHLICPPSRAAVISTEGISGPINRASIKPSADSRRLSGVPRHNSRCKRIAAGYDAGCPAATPSKSHSSTSPSRCHSRVMRDVSQRRDPPLEGQTRHFRYPLCSFGAPRRRALSGRFRRFSPGPLLYERGGSATALLLRRALPPPREQHIA